MGLVNTICNIGERYVRSSCYIQLIPEMMWRDYAKNSQKVRV